MTESEGMSEPLVTFGEVLLYREQEEGSSRYLVRRVRTAEVRWVGPTRPFTGQAYFNTLLINQ